jgi:hypothetical protein
MHPVLQDKYKRKVFPETICRSLTPGFVPRTRTRPGWVVMAESTLDLILADRVVLVESQP